MNATLKYGLLAGVVSSIILVGAHFVSFDLSQSWSFGIIASTVIPIVFMVIGIKAVRDSQEGFISLGEGLKTSFIIFMICSLIVGIAQYVLFQTFTDEMWTKIVDTQTEKVVELMEMVGADGVAMDAAMEEVTMEKIKESTSGVGSMMINLLVSGIMGLVISLVVSAIMKRNPTP